MPLRPQVLPLLAPHLALVNPNPDCALPISSTARPVPTQRPCPVPEERDLIAVDGLHCAAAMLRGLMDIVKCIAARVASHIQPMAWNQYSPYPIHSSKKVLSRTSENLGAYISSSTLFKLANPGSTDRVHPPLLQNLFHLRFRGLPRHDSPEAGRTARILRQKPTISDVDSSVWGQRASGDAGSAAHHQAASDNPLQRTGLALKDTRPPSLPCSFSI